MREYRRPEVIEHTKITFGTQNISHMSGDPDSNGDSNSSSSSGNNGDDHGGTDVN